MEDDYYDMIIRGTGDEDYSDYLDGDGEGLYGGARKKKKKVSSYNLFVKKYAKQYDLSIPEAAHEIKRKGLWKGTSTKKKSGSKTSKRRRIGSKAPKRRVVKRRTTKKKTVGRKRKPGRPKSRGRGLYMGGATIEELDRLMKEELEKRKNFRSQESFNKKFAKLRCERIKNKILNEKLSDEELNILRGEYEQCLTDLAKKKEIPKTSRPKRLNKRQRAFYINYLFKNDTEFPFFEERKLSPITDDDL